MFGFIEHVKEKKAKLAAATDIEQVSEESEESMPEELGTEDPGPKRMGQVCRRKVLMRRN